MSYDFKIGLLSFTLLAFIMHNCVQNTSVAKMEDVETPVEPISTMPPSDENAFEECSEITHQVLITHCGSCHQSSLKTHKAGAIAIFDLDKNADWHEALSEHDLQGIAQRTQNKSAITDEQNEAIAVFLKLKATQLNQ